MKRGMRAAAAALLAAALLPAGSFAAFASSPSFARTAEEWASLADNRLEYGEIAGLVEEYNPTVQQNQYDYRKFRADYGDTKDDISGEYRRLADELLSDIDYPSDDDAAYATMMMAALTSEMTAKQLQQQADNNLEDSEIIRTTYEMAEKALVQTAQNNMISYHTGLLSVRNAEIAREIAELRLAAARAQMNVGMNTQIGVLNAEQAVQNAEKNVISARSSTDTTEQKLKIMLGWKADGKPEIGALPALDLSRIDAMDPARDLPAALEKNYTLRANKKRLENTDNETDYNTLKSTIADNEAHIAASLNTAYQNVIAARNTYLYNQTNAALTAQTAAQTAQMHGLGTASALDNQIAQLGAEQAQIALTQSGYALFQAMEAYDWAVAGLAAASAG